LNCSSTIIWHYIDRIAAMNNHLEQSLMRHRIMTIVFALLAALAVPLFTASAQAASPFDGRYAGTATALPGPHGASNCNTIKGMDMTVASGGVVIHEIAFNGGVISYTGTVNAAGEVSASHTRQRVEAGEPSNLWTITGSIRNNAFYGSACARALHFHCADDEEGAACTFASATPLLIATFAPMPWTRTARYRCSTGPWAQSRVAANASLM
jgi:hypothetical protein